MVRPDPPDEDFPPRRPFGEPAPGRPVPGRDDDDAPLPTPAAPAGAAGAAAGQPPVSRW